MSHSPPFNSGLWNLKELIWPVQKTHTKLSHLPQLTLILSSNHTSLNTAPTLQCGLGWNSLDIFGRQPVLGSAAASSIHLKSTSLPTPHLDGLTLQSLLSRVLESFHLQSPPHYGLPRHAGMHEVRCPPHLIQAASQSLYISLEVFPLVHLTFYATLSEPTLSQNPLPIIPEMSKFAMHRSNPLQHDAILLVNFNGKSPLAYSPNLPGMGITTQNLQISGPNA
jgi:hypothetical protein